MAIHTVPIRTIHTVPIHTVPIHTQMLNGYHQMVDGLRQGGFKVEFKEFSDTNNMIPDAVLHAAVKWWLMGGN